jgi:hypothetical protein
MHCKNGDVMLYILYFCLNFCVFVVHAITRLQAFFFAYDSMQGAQVNT